MGELRIGCSGWNYRDWRDCLSWRSGRDVYAHFNNDWKASPRLA